MTLYRFADYYSWFLGQEYYQDVMSYRNNDKTIEINSKYGNSAYRMEVNEDYSTITIQISDKHFQDVLIKQTFEYGGNLLGVISIVNANRVLVTKDCNSAVDIHIVNANSQHQVAQVLFPYESIQITSQDWQRSLMEDVEISSQKEGYSRVLAQIVEINDQQILFRPLENNLYTDEQLCLCLESNYAKDVHLAHQFQKGDEVYLILNGKYALHDDGDNINDIAPLSIIPTQYINE